MRDAICLLIVTAVGWSSVSSQASSPGVAYAIGRVATSPGSHGQDDKSRPVSPEASVLIFARQGDIPGVVRHILALENRPNEKLVVRTAHDIETAAAIEFAGVKTVLYNPEAFTQLSRLSETDWVVVFLIAHEVIHHLLGHTTHAIPTAENYGAAELEVNERAGFILKRLGAPLTDALRATASACAFVNASPVDTKATVDAVERGWRRVT